MLHKFDVLIFRQTGIRKFTVNALDVSEAIQLGSIMDENNEMRLGIKAIDLGPVNTDEVII